MNKEYRMIWYGMIWYGMIWYGMIWYGMISLVIFIDRTINITKGDY
jgi:hypothetical protein